jgi:PHD/YefM family antitoxin component YafN of YafNO toxin-antitoxin module
MATIRANDVRIPAAARDAVARHEEVVVLNHGRPVFVILNPDDYADRRAGERRKGRLGRPLDEALDLLANAPLPDPGFAEDMEAVLADARRLAPDEDPWERS